MYIQLSYAVLFVLFIFGDHDTDAVDAINGTIITYGQVGHRCLTFLRMVVACMYVFTFCLVIACLSYFVGSNLQTFCN